MFLSFQNSNNANDGSPMFSSDVETFNGKIVYNLDGSAFIIDAGSANLSSSSATPTTATTPTPIASALTSETIASTSQKGVDKFHKSVENKGLVQGQSQSQIQSVAEEEALVGSESWRSSPKVHSFRVVSAQDASTHCQDPSNASPMHKHKPILMCFICKLSFGNVNSFSLHANTDHRLNLKELEQQLLKREYSSAIIQRNMDEEPQISFLQPLDTNTDDGASANKIGTSSVSASELVEPIDRATVDGKECTASTSHHSHLSVDNCRSLYHDTNDDDEANKKTNADGTTAHEASSSASTSTFTSLELEEHSAVKYSSLNSAIAKTNVNPLKTSASEGISSASTTKPFISSTSASTSTSPLPKPVNPSDNVEGTPAPAPEPTPEPSMCAESQVDSPPEGLKASSTDNISNDKTTNKRNKDADSKITYSSLKKGDQVHRSPNVPTSALGSTASTTSSDSSQPMYTTDSDAAQTAAEVLQKHFLLLQQQQQQVSGGGGEFPPIQAQTQAQLSSFQASLAALANEQNSRGVKLLTEFLQLHQQNQLNQSFPTSCPEHADFKGVDCKTCELIDIQHRMKSPATAQSQSQSQPQPQRSPNTNSCGLSTSMPISPSASSAASVGNAPASSFTIGACSEHISGRPQGVDCAR